MLARTGNMAEVYRAFWDMREVALRAEAWINEPQRATSGDEAEIAEGATADWYLVQTFPGDDLKAMRYLARRRFGVFRPMQQRTDKRTEVKLQGFEPVFPGWLFVYCWDIGKMIWRIKSCPGVMGILSNPNGCPAAVDKVDKEGVRFIDRLRALSWVYEDNAPRLQRHQPPALPAPSRPTRPGKDHRKALKRLRRQLRKHGKWDASTWAAANGLAPMERIALLRRTLVAPPL